MKQLPASTDSLQSSYTLCMTSFIISRDNSNGQLIGRNGRNSAK